MKLFQRPETLSEVANRILDGADAGMEIKDFLHEFHDRGGPAMLEQAPEILSGRLEKGALLDAYLQAVAVYLSAKIDSDPPNWTHPALKLSDPWFASPGAAIRNYLLISSPGPFRSRNLFIDEDSLSVV
ncbi:MAG TPA: hypothetical protein VGO67_06185 [Verrucomicrobiae bacterium]|jgi:hypothetical protein